MSRSTMVCMLFLLGPIGALGRSPLNSVVYREHVATYCLSFSVVSDQIEELVRRQEDRMSKLPRLSEIKELEAQWQAEQKSTIEEMARKKESYLRWLPKFSAANAGVLTAAQKRVFALSEALEAHLSEQEIKDQLAQSISSESLSGALAEMLEQGIRKRLEAGIQ